MRSEIDPQSLRPIRDKAMVRLISKNEVQSRSFEVIRQGYDVRDDWELGILEAVGEGDFAPLVLGQKVIVRAGGGEKTGGKAGADISRLLGERRETHIIVTRHEIVAGVLEEATG